MCSEKDIDMILEQLQQCHNREEKKRILEQLHSCVTCKEKPAVFARGETRCKCELEQYAKFHNIFEHVARPRTVKK
jgi:hypothetical protein